jgi:Phage integrase family.
VVVLRGTWDQGLDYEKTKRLLVEKIKQVRGAKGVRARCALAYTCVLLFQLRNGSRVSEAVDAVKRMGENQKKEVEVPVRKHRFLELRKMVVPEELREEDRLDCASVLEYIKTANVEMFARRSLGFNTHSLRYARITHLVKKGVSPSLIAKITHHRRLDYVLRYTEQKAADELNREIA